MIIFQPDNEQDVENAERAKQLVEKGNGEPGEKIFYRTKSGCGCFAHTHQNPQQAAELSSLDDNTSHQLQIPYQKYIHT